MVDKEDQPDYRLPGEMLTAQLLAMMENWSGYGYELAKRLEKTGLRGYNSGSLYRTLRQMERHGLITSLWDTSASGPAKRVYSMTGAGSLFLRNWLKMVEMHKDMLESFLGMSDDGVADEPDEPAVKPEVKKSSGRKASSTKATAPQKTATKTSATKKTTPPKGRARTAGTKTTGKRAVAGVSSAKKADAKVRPASKVKPAARKTAKSSTPRTSPSRKKTNKSTD
jgi:poly-beta-hydroxybutyrate-responsive repressor